MLGIQLIVHSFIHHQTLQRIGDSPQEGHDSRRTKCKEEQNQDEHKDGYDPQGKKTTPVRATRFSIAFFFQKRVT